MGGISNIVVATLNFLSLLWSLFIIAGASFLIAMKLPGCGATSPVAQLFFGILLLVLSVVAIIGAIRNHRLFLSIYLWSLVAWIVVDLAYASLAFASVRTLSTAVRERREFKFHEYPAWLRTFGGNKWNEAKECMVQTNSCNLINSFDKRTLDNLRNNPTMYGCCQPPPECGFKRKNGTVWVIPRSGRLRSKDTDCKLWSNHEKKMCYNCNSCKAAQILTDSKMWPNIAIYNVVFSILLSIVLSITCYTYRKVGEDNLGT